MDRDTGPSNWGAFGPDDEIGTVNYLDPDAVMRAAHCVITGERFRLDLPLDTPGHKSVRRFPDTNLAPPFQKVAFNIKVAFPNMDGESVVVNDDYVTFALQGSTQWDSLAHLGFQEAGKPGVYYNGYGPEAVDDQGFAHKNSIDNVAALGIVGRGVLLDIARMKNPGSSKPLSSSELITPEITAACIEAQEVEIRPGDIVCFRTGWIEQLKRASPEGRLALYDACPGLTASHASMAHEQRWAAVAVDNTAVDAVPLIVSKSAHITMMRNLGLLFGELFDFEALSAACEIDRRWEFMFVSCPLRVPGGLGSPSNSIAIR
jgi:kynurenine formamidase